MPIISETEKKRRSRINASVLGTHAMEGMYPDATTQALLRKYEAGELTREQLSAEIDRHVESLVISSRRVISAA